MAETGARPGDLALALVATVHRRRDDATELLASGRDAATWCRDIGLSAPEDVPDASLRRLRRLREAIHLLATTDDWVAGDVEEALALVNREARSPAAPVLAIDRTAHQVDEPAVVARIACDAVELFSTTPAERIRECANEPCTTLFVDRSQAGRRRWCSIERCGNRAHVAAHRRRRARA